MHIKYFQQKKIDKNTIRKKNKLNVEKRSRVKVSTFFYIHPKHGTNFSNFSRVGHALQQTNKRKKRAALQLGLDFIMKRPTSNIEYKKKTEID